MKRFKCKRFSSPWHLGGYRPAPLDVLPPEFIEYDDRIKMRLDEMKEEELDYLESNNIQYRGSRQWVD